MPPVWIAIAVSAFVVQGAAWVWVAAGLRRVRDQAEGRGEPERRGEPDGQALSVVVAAHNEAGRLPALLDALAAQTWRPFEVIVVDDRSTDGTAELVRQRAEAFPVPLREVSVAEGAPEAAGLPPKKHALTRGVEAATSGRVVCTDADGRPGPDWLATVAGFATAPGGPDDEAVWVGYGPYVEAPGWLNRFVRYETLQTAVLAAAAIGHGRPWHAVGRNLSVPTALLARLGYAHSAASLSGDDDLLVQEVARRGVAPVGYLWSRDAAVPSPAPADAGAFWRQKRRHASAGTHYAAGVLAALGLFHTSNLVLWLAAPLAHVLTGHPLGWGLVAAKLLLQRTVLVSALDDLGDEPDLRIWQPVLDALSAGYHAVLAVLGALPAPRRW